MAYCSFESRWRLLLKTACVGSLVHFELHEPAQQQVVVELLNQQPLIADGVEKLEPRALVRDGWPASAKVEVVEAARKACEDLIDQGPDAAQGMVGGDALLERDVAEDPGLFGVVATNKTNMA